MDRRRVNQACDRLVADEERDHGEDDRAREACEIAELARAEGEARIVRVAASEGVGERGEQQRASVGAHMQPVGDQRDRTGEPAADDLGRHHRRAQPDDGPGSALARRVPLAQEHMTVEGRKRRAFGFAHQRGLIEGRSGRHRATDPSPRRSARPDGAPRPRDESAHGPRPLPPSGRSLRRVQRRSDA